MNKSYAIGLLLVLFAVAGVVGCGGGGEEAAQVVAKDIKRLDVWVKAKSETELDGTAIFINEGPKVALVLTLENAPPGQHAVHLHGIGDCSADDASSAGGHWNPTGAKHGPWGSPAFHLGDIGNIPVYEDGTGRLEITTRKWSMGTGEDNDIIGKAIVVHEGEDDFTTQPTGNAGGRIGCGEIKP